MRRCHGCGAQIESSEKILRTDECLRCGRDLRCCRNCRHYHRSAHNQCLEPVAEWVADKEKANFCDYFSFAETGPGESRPSGGSPEAAAREKWEKLFRSHPAKAEDKS